MNTLFVFKLLHGIVNSNLSKYVEAFTFIHNTRGNLFKLKKTEGKLLIHQNHFVNKCVNNCTLLNDSIVCIYFFAVGKRYII